MKILLPIALAIAAVACGGANLQTIHIVNRTNRPIVELYVHPSGAPRGASRGSLAPNATTDVKVAGGRVSVTAVSAKLQVDERTRDQPSATQELELTARTEVIFYDEGQPVAGLERKGTVGAAFVVPRPRAPQEPGEAPEAAPEQAPAPP